jgi:anaerobic selenocysteine-containing dehydrogenase
MSCGVLVTLKNGTAIEIKGDAEDPMTRGALCKIGQALLQYLYHPDRLKVPLKRTGERGQGRWQEIGWDEAFEVTAEALNTIKEEHGPEAVFMAHGSAKGYMDTHLVRLANAFGTPNVVCSDHVCHVPKMLAAEMTFGFYPSAEYGHPPACILVWGGNPAETRFMMYRMLVQAYNKGAKLVVIDPLKTGIAEMAAMWLPVRPGSDLALALGMLNVIINDGLYDKDFVTQWTVGFEQLTQHVQDYTPERAAGITWIPAEQIVAAARLYAASKPAHIEWGNALDHNVNSFQTQRALAILMAITGNLGVPGGEIEEQGSGFLSNDPWQPSAGIHRRWSSELELRDNIPIAHRQKKVGAELTFIPDFRYTTPQAVTKAILHRDPYSIRGAYIQASNPLSSWCNIHNTRAAFEQLDFLAVSDMFMTPTAMLADIVFPAATTLEYDGVCAEPCGSAPPRIHRKVVQIGECRSDHEIVLGLAERLGLERFFWKSPKGFWDTIVEPLGLTFEECMQSGLSPPVPSPAKEYRRYERDGFNTSSGKVELYSERLAELGLDPLPVYQECPETPYSDPELAKEYPLLCTTRKVGVYRHSGGRQIPGLRKHHPDPVVIIHPETADKVGIADGDWVFIENRRGKIRQKAQLSTGVDHRVVIADHAWWFPEQGEAGEFGWADANYNVLTNDQGPFNRAMGSFNIRGIACKVYKAV